MKQPRQISQFEGRWEPSRWRAHVVILLVLLLLAMVILAARQQLRRQVRDQIAGRDGQVLHALWLSQQETEATTDLPLTDKPADQLAALLETSRLRQLKELRATRLFDRESRFVTAFPIDVPEATLRRGDMEQLAQLRPITRFHPAFRPAALSELPEADSPQPPAPFLEVLLPLHASGDARLLGVAQFMIHSPGIAAEFRALDHHLNVQAALAFVAAGAVLTLVLAVAFRQLERANTLLARRTRSLLQANQELTLAAKTSAVGAVTAHLIHGLKNPLSGLQNFIAGRAGDGTGAENPDWQVAAATAQRMQTLIHETVRVLREHGDTADYELSLGELVDVAATRLAAAAREAGVILEAQTSGDATFNNRDANLILLVLENLLHNALQASPRGATVTLAARRTLTATTWEVRDQGPGLPAQVEATLFKPGPSTKAGGSGIGLAISKQLAAALGAELELKCSSASGCVFALSMPVERNEAAAHPVTPPVPAAVS